MIDLKFEKCGYETKITFKYDKDLVDAIKSLPERRYVPHERAWYVPNYMLSNLSEILPDEIVPEIIDDCVVDVTIRPTGFSVNPEPKIRDSRFQRMMYIQNPRNAFGIVQLLEDIGVEVNLQGYNPNTGLDPFYRCPELYEFQEEAVKFLMEVKSGLIALDPGLGKTITALEYVNRSAFRSCMVVAPGNVCEQWNNVLKEHFEYDEGVVITGQIKKKERMELYQKPFTIVSYDILRRDNVYPHVDCLILDEVQKVKNWNTQRAKSVSRIVAQNVVGLTGTPIENKLEELYFILDQIIPAYFGSFGQFQEKFIVRDYWGKVEGYKNEEEVYQSLQDVMFRKLKEEVDAQLPRRIEVERMIEITSEEKKIYQSIMDKGHEIGVVAELKVATSNPALKGELKGLSSKEELLKDLLTDELRGKKIVVFTQYKKNMARFKMLMKGTKIPYTCIFGGMGAKLDEAKEKFLEMKGGVLFMTDVGMAGLDKLQVANVLINFDLPWNPAHIDQRESRIDRLGSKHESVLLINLVQKGMYDEHILKVLKEKGDLIDAVVDGKSYESEIANRIFGGK